MQPYTVSDASSGSSQVRSRVPEHWLLLHKTWLLVITHLVDSDAGLQPPVTSTEPPLSIVVADALTQPRGSGVGVGVMGVFVGVGVTGVFVGVGVTGVSVGVGGTVGAEVNVAVGGTGVAVGSQTTCQVSGSHSQPPPRPLSVVG